MTMYPFNSSVRRNWDNRLKLHNKANELLAEAKKMEESLINIEDDDEWERRNDEIVNTVMRQFWEIYRLEFALRYPESRNEWFKKFVSSFPIGRTQISEKQYRIFAKYCENNEEDAWRTCEMYCRIGDKFITIKWENSHRTVTIQQINTNLSELLN